MNQLFNDITTALQWLQAGKIPQWISAADNGGVAVSYTLFSRVLYTDGLIYQSMDAANTDTPGATAKWVRVRVRLGANLTLYVRTDGSNSNNGSANNAGNAFLTAAYAATFVQKNYDLNGFVVTIVCNVGAYTDSVQLTGPLVGAAGRDSLVFDSTGGTVTRTVTGNGFVARDGAQFTVKGHTIAATIYGIIAVGAGANIAQQGNTLGICGAAHLCGTQGGVLATTGADAISGSSPNHIIASVNGVVTGSTLTTLTGTPAFSSGYAAAQQNGTINVSGATFSGAATGPRYLATLNGVIDTGAGGASFFPGNAAGSTATGGQYN